MTEEGREPGKTKEDIEQAIKQLVSKAVISDKVVDIFAVAGIKTPDISILSEEFVTFPQLATNNTASITVELSAVRDAILRLQNSLQWGYIIKTDNVLITWNQSKRTEGKKRRSTIQGVKI
jgi:hypothetical protein